MSEAEYNDDELVPPIWLNLSFIQRMLHDRFNNNQDNKNNCNLKVWNLVIKPATLKGDHYASLMFRASYKFQCTAHTNDQKCAHLIDVDESVIVKTMPANDTDKGKNLNDTPIHKTEHCMYTQVIPAFEAIWRAHGEDVKFAGRLLYAVDKPTPALVLEDLCPMGYITLNGRPFTQGEVEAIWCKLAKWHAVSYKLAIEAQPQWAELTAMIKEMQHGLFKMENLMKSPLMNGGLRTLIEVLTDVGGFEEYLPRLRTIEPKLVSQCIAMQNAYLDRVQGPLYVLNHGDFHAKNIMYRKGPNGEAEDFLFVDYQMNFFGTSTYDVRYSSYTVIGKELRESKREDLLKFYFDNFLESLQKLQFNGKMPTFDDFQADWRRWKAYELYALCTMAALGNIPEGTSNEWDINLLLISDEYRKSFYKNHKYIEYVKKRLPEVLELDY